MATTWLSNGAQTGGSGSYVAGTQSVQYIHDTFALTGDTIQIPNGTYSWTGTLNLSKAVTLQGDTTGGNGVVIQNNLASGLMISAVSGTVGHIRIAWLKFVQVINNGAGAGFCVGLNRNDATAYTVLVHDCYFDGSAVYNYMLAISANGHIVWNCTFVGSGANGIGGITLVCGKYGDGTATGRGAWNAPSTMGTLDTDGLNNTYIEDCTFNAAPTGTINADDNSRVVVRHCTVIDSDVHAHGQDTSQYGVRHYEIYNNTFKNVNAQALNLNSWTYIRGAVAIIANNTVDAPPPGKFAFIWACQSINRGGNIVCQTAYPAARQVGYGWSASSSSPYGTPAVQGPTSGLPFQANDGIGQAQDPCYVWGNSGAGITGTYVVVDQYTPDNCGNGLLSSNFVQSGRDYFVGTARPGWTPYTYPHPLRTAGVLPSGSYSTSFPASENPISEGGIWLNGLTDGLDWCNVRTTPGLAFGTESGTDTGNAQYNDSTAILKGTWGPNQTVQGTIRVISPSAPAFQECELRLRSTISAHSCTGYEVLISVSTDPNKVYANVVRWNGALGSFTTLVGASVHGVDGDILKATMIGSVITVFLNNAQIMQVTDTTYASGNPGLGLWLSSGTGINANYGWSAFSASDGTSGGGVTQRITTTFGVGASLGPSLGPSPKVLRKLTAALK